MKPAIYEGNEPYFFVSYAHKDADEVYRVLNELQARGYRFWYDVGISPGSEWPEDVARHLDSAETVLAFISPNSMESNHCRRELSFSLSRGKRSLIIELEKAEIPLGMQMQLADQQHVKRHNYEAWEEFVDRILRYPDIQKCREGWEAECGLEPNPVSKPMSQSALESASGPAAKPVSEPAPLSASEPGFQQASLSMSQLGSRQAFPQTSQLGSKSIPIPAPQSAPKPATTQATQPSPQPEKQSGKRSKTGRIVALIIAAVVLAAIAFALFIPSKFTVSFESGEGSEVSAVEVTRGEELAAPQPPTRKNFEFAGWYLDEGLSEKAEFPMKVTGDVRLYAAWNEVLVSYTVNYLRSGTDEPIQDPKVVEGNSIGSEVTEEAPQIDGYKIANKESQKLKLRASEDKNVITFSYKKVVGYTVNYVVQGSGTVILNPKVVTDGVEGDAVTEEAPAIDGYTLVSGSPQTIVLTEDAEANTITFSYTPVVVYQAPVNTSGRGSSSNSGSNSNKVKWDEWD